MRDLTDFDRQIVCQMAQGPWTSPPEVFDRKKFVKVAECKVGEMVVATPAPGKKRLWIRGAKSLYCVGENAK